MPNKCFTTKKHRDRKLPEAITFGYLASLRAISKLHTNLGSGDSERDYTLRVELDDLIPERLHVLELNGFSTSCNLDTKKSCFLQDLVGRSRLNGIHGRTINVIAVENDIAKDESGDIGCSVERVLGKQSVIGCRKQRLTEGPSGFHIGLD
ncbi:hypothetical protein HG530_008453 [Fusarium avenaceum]|nr:hypothetical protein HG530_008453 [Fusarium avenaceum]